MPNKESYAYVPALDPKLEGVEVRMLEFVGMDAREFKAYRLRAIEDYTRESILSGKWSPDTAAGLTAKMIGDLLPDGLDTENHFLYSLMDREVDTVIGAIWFGIIAGGGIYLFDLIVYEQYRRRGYGTEAMRRLEIIAAGLGGQRILLNVFRRNRPAVALYDKLGYQTVNMLMEKELGHSDLL